MKDSRIKITEGESGEVAVTLPYNPTYIRGLKGIKGHRWNPEQKCWMFPYSDNIIKRLFDIFKGEDVWVDPSLRQGKENKTLSDDLRREMVSRKYSPKTVKAYLYYNRDFLEFIGKKSESIREGDIKDYLFHLVEEKKVATSTLNSAINALKFYYRTILKKKFLNEIKRPRKDKKLPEVLNEKEVISIFQQVKNLKHRAILYLIYSAGLRVSEVVKLKIEDIDSNRMLIHIKDAKGRKDRYTILSGIALEALRGYYKKYRPEKWLFAGQRKGKYYSTRSVENILKEAVKKAGIRKHVTVHTLRHTFATHLLEAGVNLRYIQELLGHKSPKTTEIYTHISKKHLGKIINPLDVIFAHSKNKRNFDEKTT